MGLMTLAEFETELAAVVGGRADIGSPRIRRWINFGYYDVTGAVEFEELEQEAALISVAEQEFISLPADTRAVTALKSASGLLQWIPKHEWIRLSGAASGTPTKWTRIGDQIKLSPKPTAVINYTAFVKVDPAALAADADVTVIPKTWDMAVHYFAVSHAYFAMGEGQAGTAWANRAIAYMQTRAVEERRKLIEPGLGGSLPPSRELLAGPVAPANGYNPQG